MHLTGMHHDPMAVAGTPLRNCQQHLADHHLPGLHDHSWFPVHPESGRAYDEEEIEKVLEMHEEGTRWRTGRTS
jgi:hypothetical protein